MTATSPFVTTAWLAARLAEPDVQVIDGSWYLPGQNRNAGAEFEQGHIPGAIVFDIDAIADRSTDLPHMLLDADSFAREAGALGIASDKTLVVYDGAGLFSAARVWWTLRYFGAPRVVVLQGGLPLWKAEGRPLESGPAQAQPAVFAAKCATSRVANLGSVREILSSGSAQVVDARPAARFRGDAPEPRPGIESGHMPGSLNLPFSEIVHDGQLDEPAALRSHFERAGVDLDRPIVTTCGSGVSAAILVLALETLGKPDAVLYDGSWADYASAPDSMIEKG